MKNELLALLNDRPDDIDWSVLEATHPAVQWVKEYYDTYQSLPTFELFKEECISDGEEAIPLAPWSYYVRQNNDLKFVQEAQKYLENFNKDYINDPKKAILDLRTKFQSLSEPATSVDPVDVAASTTERWARFAKRKGKGIKTGIEPFDEASGGLVPEDEFLILSARLGMGKALKYGTRVLDPQGNFRPVEEFKVGDYLMGTEGVPIKILGVRDFDSLNLYRVTFGDSSYIDCCEDHLWTVRRDGKYHTLTTKEILSKGIKCIGKGTGTTDNKEHNYYNYYLPPIQPMQFPEKEFIIPPYIMGVILGDGNITTSSLTLCSFDEGILNEVRSQLPDYLILNKLKAEGDYSIRWKKRTSCPSPFTAELRRYNLFGKRSHEKFIPRDYLQSSPQQRLELLAGILDTDGYFPGQGSIELSLSSERLMDDVIYLVESLGGQTKKRHRAAAYSHNGKYRSAKNSYEISIHLQQDIPLRKTYKNRWIKPRIRKTRPIIDISPIAPAGGRCFIVDSLNHLFITEHFIPTHNSFVALYMALTMAKQGLNVGIYSGEMSEDQVGARIDTWLTHVSNWNLTRGRLQSGLEEQIQAYQSDVPGKILVLTQKQLGRMATPTDIKRFIKEHNLTAVVIDQLSLMNPDGRQYPDMHMQFATLSTQLRALQQVERIPFIAVSQLNRAAEGEEAGASNLSGSDKIGQDATCVLVIERSRDGSEVTIKCVKAREYKVPPKGWSFTWDIDKGILSHMQTAIDSIKAKAEAAKKADTLQVTPDPVDTTEVDFG